MHKRHSSVLLAVCGLLWGVYAFFAAIGLDRAEDILAPFISFFAAYGLFRATAASANYRKTWMSAALGISAWGLADAVWAGERLFLGMDPSGNVFLMYLYGCMNFFLLFSVLYLSFYDRRRWTSFQFLVDVIAIFCSLAVFLYYVFFSRRILNSVALDTTGIAFFVCLITDLLLLTFCASLILSMYRKKMPLFLHSFFTGLILFVISHFIYTYAVFNGLYRPDSWIDAVFLLSISFIGAGGFLFLDNPVDPSAIRKQTTNFSGYINRSILLLCIPVFAMLIRKVRVQDLFPFILIIFLHQIVSLIIRRLLRKEIELEEKSRQAEYFEATIADRMRELRIMNQTLENLLKRDAITGQYNRKYFLECIDDWIAHAKSDEKIWLLILDFDRFKTINDTYGHDTGDQVLRIFGKQLETVSNDRTVLARLGGDEFGIVCRRSASESITSLLHTIDDLSGAVVSIGQYTVHVSLSIGISSYPDDALTRSDLMRHADIAMYITKNRRMSGFSFFDISLNAGIERSHQIDLALKSASFDDEFTLMYQAQVATGGHRLVGMEALVRWKSPTLGIISPDEFIPVAEENGVIFALSDWIARKALRQIADWNTCYGLNLLMGINVSPYQLDEVDFLEKLTGEMDDNGVKPEWVNLELTERSAMKGERFIIDLFDRLSELNITTSIDDFGTGYSSLSYIKQFNISYLKIAKQLVDGIVTNETDELIVQAIISMSTALHVRTIAEGVENEEQLRILEKLGCDEIQGYYFGKPESPEKFEELFLKGPEPELL